jgi:hypothetical protein
MCKTWQDTKIHPRPRTEDAKFETSRGVIIDVVRPGRVLYELEGVSADLAKEAFHLARHKLAVSTRVIGREQVL